MKAVIFPGQGAQYVGMGKSLSEYFPCAKNMFSSIDSILGFSLSDKCFQGQESELKETSIQQLAILAVSLAAFEVFKEKELKIDYLSGLSLGEYSCLYAAEVINLNDLVNLVNQRAKAMNKAALDNPSTMFAVMGIEREALKGIAEKENFYIANINSPGQTVVSLAKERRDNIFTSLESDGARVIELPVSGGFHSPFMNSAKEHLATVVEAMNFSDAKIPIVSNFTAKGHTKAEEVKNNLLEQLTSTVLWNDSIDYMTSTGVDLFFEVGPSKVLRGLMRKINREAKVVNIGEKQDLSELWSCEAETRKRP
ncbi:MAG: ACP S-malonyltransferase [Candidatus Omnitrophica bacterium]|nr:ACP S-malonyltransferase [Candidatus Omnitrophota bacterium]